MHSVVITPVVVHIKRILCLHKTTINRSFSDCTELDKKWEHLSSSSTEPEFPVEHDTLMTVHCESGFINRGGIQVKCQYGELLLADKDPLCQIISMFYTLNAAQILSRLSDITGELLDGMGNTKL